MTVDDYTAIFRLAFSTPKNACPTAEHGAIQHLALRMALADPVNIFVPLSVFWTEDFFL